MLVACAVLACGDIARADTPEYWHRETFKTERSTLDPLPERRERSSRSSYIPRVARATVNEGSARPSRLGAPKSAETTRRSKSKGVRVASLGNTYVPEKKPARSLSGGGGIKWLASSGCLNGTLRGVLSQVAASFGAVTVNSTCRSRSHNARVGGASRSWHLTGDAADFRVHGNWGGASSFLRSSGSVGGFKHYGGGLFHIDTGPRRSW
jgi:hypothetical protein